MTRSIRAVPALALAAVLTACGGGLGVDLDAGAVHQVEVTVPEQPDSVGHVEHAAEVAVADDGTVVVLLDDASTSGVVRVRDGEVVSRAHLTDRAAQVVPRADGSVAVVAVAADGRAVRAGVVPEADDPDDVATVETVPVEPPLHVDDELAEVHAVLAPDGESVVVLLQAFGAQPLLLTLDPATGVISSELDLTLDVDAFPTDLLLTEDGEGIVVVLATAGTSVVLRMPAVLPAEAPPPVLLDDHVRGAVLGPDDELVGVRLHPVERDDGERSFDGLTVVTLPADETEAEEREVPVPDWPVLPKLSVDDVATDPDGSHVHVAGSAGEDTDNPYPVLIGVDLTTGEVAAPVELAGWGWADSALVVEDLVLAVGGTQVGESRTTAAALWFTTPH